MRSGGGGTGGSSTFGVPNVSAIVDALRQVADDTAMHARARRIAKQLADEADGAAAAAVLLTGCLCERCDPDGSGDITPAVLRMCRQSCVACLHDQNWEGLGTPLIYAEKVQ